MYNWSVDIRRLRKDRRAYEKWQLEQMINYGLGEDKLDEKMLSEHWRELRIDVRKRDYLKLLLWPNQS